MRCVLHIGTEKTGSTSIQQALEKHSDALLQQGTLYPKVFHRGNHPKIACYAMEDGKIDMRKKRYKLTNKNAVKEFRKDFEKTFANEVKPRGVKSVIIVNEHLSRLRKQTEVERLKSLLDKHFSQVDIILYLRRQDKLMRSMYSTVVKVGGVRENVFPIWPEDSTGDFTTFDYRRITDLWTDVWGRENVTVRIFDRKSLLDGDVVSDFMEFAKVKSPRNFKASEGNPSLSPQALVAIRELNKYIPKEARANIGPMAGRLFPGKGASVSKEKADEFMAIFEDGNAHVARNFFNRDTLFEPLTESDYPSDVEAAANEPSIDDFAKIFAALWSEKSRQYDQLKKKVK